MFISDEEFVTMLVDTLFRKSTEDIRELFGQKLFAAFLSKHIERKSNNELK